MRFRRWNKASSACVSLLVVLLNPLRLHDLHFPLDVQKLITHAEYPHHHLIHLSSPPGLIPPTHPSAWCRTLAISNNQSAPIGSIEKSVNELRVNLEPIIKTTWCWSWINFNIQESVLCVYCLSTTAPLPSWDLSTLQHCVDGEYFKQEQIKVKGQIWTWTQIFSSFRAKWEIKKDKLQSKYWAIQLWKSTNN